MIMLGLLLLEKIFDLHVIHVFFIIILSYYRSSLLHIPFFVFILSTIIIINNVHEALGHPKWQQAMIDLFSPCPPLLFLTMFMRLLITLDSDKP